MANSSRYLIAALTALATVCLMASTASSQDVRRYGEQGGGSDGGGGGGGGGGGQRQMTYPGQPMPQDDQQSGNQQQSSDQQRGEEDGEEEEGETGSYAIQIHEPGERFDEDGDGGEEEDERPDIFDRPANKIYKGIIPGDRDQVEHLESGSDQTGREGNRLTWIGFQPKDAKSRVFVQFSQRPDYSVSRNDEGRQIVVTLERTRVTAGNFRRDIDTRFFDRAIRRIRTETVGNGTVELRIDLEEAKSPSVSTDGNYLYVDFDYQKPDDDDDSGE